MRWIWHDKLWYLVLGGFLEMLWGQARCAGKLGNRLSAEHVSRVNRKYQAAALYEIIVINKIINSLSLSPLHWFTPFLPMALQSVRLAVFTVLQLQISTVTTVFLSLLPSAVATAAAAKASRWTGCYCLLLVQIVRYQQHISIFIESHHILTIVGKHTLMMS